MTIVEALKVAQEACKMQSALEAASHAPFFEHEKKSVELMEAAAVLARLEQEWPIIVADMRPSILSRLLKLDAAPKEGS